MEPAEQLSTQQRILAFWGPRPRPKAVTVPGATEERCHILARLAQDLPQSPWGSFQGLAGTFFYGSPAHFYLTGIKEHVAQSAGHHSILLFTWPLHGLCTYSMVSGLWASQGRSCCVG